jgi:hypothetical protein
MRPHIGAQLLKALEPLQVQAIYDQLSVGGRRDGKPGGLAPSTFWPCIAACTARSSRRSPGGWSPAMSPRTSLHATPTPRSGCAGAGAGRGAVGRCRPHPLTMAWRLDGACGGDRARNGELCGLEWTDLDLDAGTVRFRQALTIVDPTVLPASLATAVATPAAGARNWPSGRSSPRPATPSSACHPSPSRHCDSTAPKPDLMRWPTTALLLVRGCVAGTGFEPV